MAMSTNVVRALIARTSLLPRCREHLFQTVSKVTQPCLVTRILPVTSTCCHAFSTTTDSLARRQTRTQHFSTSPAIQYEENEESDTLQKVNERLASPDVGRLFAVIHFGGVQRKVTTDDIVMFPKHIQADVGELIRFNKVLLVGGTDFSIVGRPILSEQMVKVEGRVIEKTLEHTKIHYNYTARRNNSRMHLRKSPLTMVRITSIDVLPLQQ